MIDWPYHLWRDRVSQSGLKVVSTLPGPVIALKTLRAQCEVVPIDFDSDLGFTHPDDALLLAYLEAAVDYAEDLTGLSIALRTYEIAMDGFPWNGVFGVHGIELPFGPFVSVESFIAPSGGSSDGEFDLGDDYLIDDYVLPVRLLPVSTWPTLMRSSNAIKIRFRAGYRTDDYFDTDYDGAQMMPASIRQALLLLVDHFYENRSDSVDGTVSSIPNGVTSLLRLKQVRLGMA